MISIIIIEAWNSEITFQPLLKLIYILIKYKIQWEYPKIKDHSKALCHSQIKYTFKNVYSTNQLYNLV